MTEQCHSLANDNNLFNKRYTDFIIVGCLCKFLVSEDPGTDVAIKHC